MTVSASDLQTYVGSSPDDVAYVSECLTESMALVDGYLGTQKDAIVTAAGAVVDRAYKEVGAELFNRRDTKNGISQFGSMDSGNAIRIARDPMISGRALLAPFVGGGFA